MFVTLGIEANYPACAVITQNCICEISKESPPTTCDVEKRCTKKPSGVTNALLVLTAFTLIVLTVFLVELALTFYAIGWRRFICDAFLMLDTVIVMGSMGIEMYALIDEQLNSNDDVIATTAASSIIIFSRGWRLLRIGHAALKEAHDFYSEKILVLEERISVLEGRGPSNVSTTDLLAAQ